MWEGRRICETARRVKKEDLETLNSAVHHNATVKIIKMYSYPARV